MHTLMFAESRRLQADIDRLRRTMPSMTRHAGLRQRARFAFITQLHAYKCDRLEEVREAIARGPDQTAATARTD
ncbi:MAG: hypothetical protein R3174_10755 [Gammaproteobacteria bacterium]|nr:hypothetical protein [Gammaproteobacteria bacterium]